jgi:hypothetical protein
LQKWRRAKEKKREMESSQKLPRLVALCASHLSDPKRVDLFVRLLESIQTQSQLPDAFFIHISYDIDKKETLVEIRKRIRKSVRLIEGAEIFEYNGKIAQFDHYSRLMDKLYEQKKICDADWVFFTDDDDLWHKDRTLLFRQGVFEACKKSNVESVIVVNETKVKQEARNKEYWEYAVPALQFRTFLSMVPAETKKHRFCDCLFVSWITRAGTRTISVIMDGEPYAYNESNEYDHLSDEAKKRFRGECTCDAKKSKEFCPGHQISASNQMDLFLAQQALFLHPNMTVLCLNFCKFCLVKQQEQDPRAVGLKSAKGISFWLKAAGHFFLCHAKTSAFSESNLQALRQTVTITSKELQ